MAELVRSDEGASAGSVEILAAERAQEPLLADLLDAYAHELSRYHPVSFGADGRFVYNELPNYWRDSGKHPFFIVMDGAPAAGFALIKQVPSVGKFEMVWDVAEFFILAAYRRRGVGTAAARGVWRQFQGSWQVRVLESNRAALVFWARAIGEFTGEQPRSEGFKKEGERWRRFCFESMGDGDRIGAHPPVH